MAKNNKHTYMYGVKFEPKTLICPVCGKEFVQRAPHQEQCSRECTQKKLRPRYTRMGYYDALLNDTDELNAEEEICFVRLTAHRGCKGCQLLEKCKRRIV